MPVHRWADWNMPGHGTISILDARDADDSARTPIKEELTGQPADIIFFFNHDEKGRGPHKDDLERLIASAQVERRCTRPGRKSSEYRPDSKNGVAQLEEALNAQPTIQDRLLEVVHLPEKESAETRRLMSLLAHELPNEAKIEMIRISHDSEAQHHVAQVLVKSTTAICTAIGTQPIPLADLPILTTLQLVMVSGIMYVSGRERSLRAATEFIGALGANVGAGMLSARRHARDPEVLSRLGKHCLRHGGWGWDLRDRARRHRLLSRGRFLEGCAPDLSGEPEEAGTPGLLPLKPAKATSVRKK